MYNKEILYENNNKIIINKFNSNNINLTQIRLKRNQTLSHENNTTNILPKTPSSRFYGTKFFKKFIFNNNNTNNNNINNNYELQQQNKLFYKKLLEIKHQNNIKKKYSNKNIFNTPRKDGHIKLNIMNLAQQNLYMLKRLYEQKSEYSVKKLEKDYQKFQNIKKIMCKFPDIDFNKSKGLSTENKFLKNEISDKSSFLPTINYINEGSMIQIKRHMIKDMKKNEGVFIKPRNLRKDFFKKIDKNSKIINNTGNDTNNPINKINAKDEFEFDKNKKNNDINNINNNIK